MTREARLGFFAVSAAGLGALLLWAVAGPALIAAAICVEEGLFTTNGLNAILVALMLALLGAALAIAVARAIRLGDRGSLESTPAERERG